MILVRTIIRVKQLSLPETLVKLTLRNIKKLFLDFKKALLSFQNCLAVSFAGNALKVSLNKQKSKGGVQNDFNRLLPITRCERERDITTIKRFTTHSSS